MLAKYHFCIIFFLLFSITTSYAADNGQLASKVIDAETGEALEYAAVALFKQSDDSVVKTTNTGEEGTFIFKGLAPGTYKIKVSFVGYISYTRENIVISAEKASRLATIKLEKDLTTLKEVVITDTKPEVEFGADTITYNVAQSIMTEGSMASDVLKNVPMLDVDIDGKVSIAGKRNTRIFINGKPSDYTSANMADLLSVLPADAIEKIEVVNNPDVRYSADGEGIVNIVMKKGYKIGLNGTLSVNAGTRGTYTGTGYLAYRTETLALGSSYGFKSILNTSNGYSITQNYKESEISSYRNRYNNDENNIIGQNLRTNLDWDITPKQNLSVSVNGSLNNSEGNSNSDDHRLNANSVEQELRSQLNLHDNHSSNIVMDADYTLKLSKKRNEKLEIGMIASFNNSDQNRSTDRSITRINSVKPFLQHNAIDVANNGMHFNADYVRSFSKLGSISLGVQASNKDVNNEQSVNEFDFSQNKDVLNPYLTNKFTFLENIYSSYASFNLRTKNRWSFRLGTRAELTDASFEQAKSGDVSMKPYFNIFPNFSVNKTFNKKYITGINYSVRINRPRENALNPLIDNRDSTNIYYGNPGLKPSITHQAQFSFSTFGKNWSFSPRISYATTKDIIERIRIPVDDNGNIETTYQNLATSTATTLSVFGNYRPTRMISTNAGFTVSHINYDSNGNIRSNKGGMSYQGTMGFALKLPQKIAFEGNLKYYNNASSQGRNKASLSSGFGLRKLFLANKLVVRVSASDPFYERSNTEFIEGLNYFQERYSTQSTRNFSVALSYRFTKTGRNTLNKQKKDVNDKELKVLDEGED